MFIQNANFAISKIYNVVLFNPKGQKQHRFPGTLPTYELMFFQEGDARLTFMGKTFTVSKGSVVYLPKGITNNRYSISVKKDFSLYNIYFDSIDPLPKEPLVYNTNSIFLQSSYEKIFRTWIGKRNGYYFKTMELAYGIFEHLQKLQSTYINHIKTDYLIPSDEYMAEHYCDTHFDYKKMAQLTGLSYSYFKKLFVEKYGSPPVKYINRLKIQRASELLMTSSFSITEVSRLCGFENVYYFSNIFKKHTGISPKKYNNNASQT